MVDQVWISEVMSNNDLGNKLGLRHKWSGEAWERPYPYHRIPDRSEKDVAALSKHYGGNTLERDELPEASAVYSASNFKRAKDVFFIGGFLGVKGKVADILSSCDFGVGGGLVDYTIYNADEKTPLPGPYYIVNFGPKKDCFLAEASTNIENLGPNHKTGEPLWSLQYLRDDDIAVSPSALVGSDLWMCPFVRGRIFMSERLVQSLRSALPASMFDELRLHRCRVVG